ncbi:alpha/beta fold hydrolase [Bacillus sp. sid0103]|uniref:alpha/beta hydrolase n=1 Tax=Bacillus sp. sid0103 TaxID=2856337 RepID=UPI001C455BEB|nr:alpha/beta hydrolase [Bacillus sp. sid0103]MBV7506926.1 alpha/beta fold hydrolase [Bacillus sp. sid0103]
MNKGEKEVTIQSGVTLKGTLCFPENLEEKAPAILIISGSGKLDRNGKVNKKMDLKLYRQLSEYLTSLGFINLRYDKRGVGASEGDFLTTGLWDLVDDAQSAVQFLKNLPEVDSEKVIVLGHSEGCTIGTAAVAKEEHIGGLILLSGAIESLNEVLKRQRDLATQDIINAKGFQGFLLRLLGAHNKVEKQAQKFIDKVLNSSKDQIKVNLIKTPAKWMREHFSYNEKVDLAKISCPVLAITGARDIQANPEVLKELPLYVKEDAQFYVVENMGHSCKEVTRTSTMFTAKKDILAGAELPLHPELEKLLENWLRLHFINSSSQESVII